ncbi:hypothetical protein MTO98_26160 [Mucilaginibacter sp. SMC90]|uniref:hypothetical protein n=1 Tax=Mucilaginibacter sp. SMC90 TaxID=2929803 RepID=UPI001FB2264F|nr:hypothetical protein [Mucilaginibacter sp. SMC90]UOE47899.1 hypothetical protein MTO98_26160 [Mucilaginibacter sp. SMC90]
MKLLFQDTAVKDVIFKMRLWEDSLPEIQSEKLSELLTHMGPELPIEEGEFSAYTTRAEGAKIIARLILNLSAERRVAHALNVFSLTDDMEFAMEICYWLFYKNEKETKKYFDAANEAEIHAYFLQRFKAAYFGKILVTDFSDSNLWRLIIWWSEADRAGLEEQLKVQLENDPLKAVQLIKVFTPTVQSWSNDGTSKLYKAGFGQTRYEAIDKLFNPAIIYNILAGTDYRVEDVKIDQLGDNDPLTDSQLANVFMYYYEYHHSSIGKF